MRRAIILGLMAATTLMPVANAAAQSRGEVRHDRRELREEQRELRQAQRHGSRHDVREERRDVREARRELRDDRRDWRRGQWRDLRNQNRRIFARGNWHAPFRYRTFSPGVRITRTYYSPRYFIVDPWRYHLPRPRPFERWVRHYDDLLLVDIRSGLVVDVIRNFYW